MRARLGKVSVTGWFERPPATWRDIADRELISDVGHGDGSSFGIAKDVSWTIYAQAEGRLCGVAIADYLLEPGEMLRMDAAPVKPGTKIVHGIGSAMEVLARERTALNFLMHLSGVATLTSKFVAAVEGTRATILDTRKTLPGLRDLERYAVRCGGAKNHRWGLDGGILLKDNHIRTAGGVRRAVEFARNRGPHLLRIEVECENLPMIEEAIDMGVDLIMLDNMPAKDMAEAVRHFAGRATFEASGGVTLENVREIAETGVDYISVGAITHSAPALPFHLEFD